MEKIPGLEEAFKKAKVVFMTTFSDNEEHTRQMTNFNENLQGTIWFPTERDTQKVEDIKNNDKVLITFPAEKRGQYFEIEGKAALASEQEVLEKWQWWWLYWHPAQKDRFWFPRERDERRVIINIKPMKAKLVKK
jgi:general stress protein 26